MPTSKKMGPSLLELPAELQRMIISQLDYESLIHLSATNRFFNHTVNPQAMADPLDKLQFVMRAAKDFPQHRPSEKGQEYHPGNFECYICFKVRSPDCFDALQSQTAYIDRLGRPVRDRQPTQADTLVSLRRFCIECGVRAGLHVASDSLTTRTGRDLWICSCLRVWSKHQVLRCPSCGGDCPLRPRKKMGVDKIPPQPPRFLSRVVGQMAT
ncbi:uncharacterized protein F5Z01DRAFT_541853 [Emericellopsis atlantica]|uniref:F-box domain-containing protein n=1 Tax=Emericellopsis atlantica TaxID=2614577 RepID=A0A9P7ZPW7_9HYPO|nr:uncharacterized protein F5Z01DRAFT_541853 [Emericellopsis atlantica]KAG9256144.1 hypothetical protein F5Z01DRAFT_541853 [Emericellopsis atlantica]